MPPPSPAPTTPPDEQLAWAPREPVTLTVGTGAVAARSVAISFRRLGERGPERVASIALDGEDLLAADCTSVTSGLCSQAHRELRGLGPATPRHRDIFGKGGHIALVSHASFEDRAFALFTSGTWGSPECGTYAYWILKLDAQGVRVTEPVEGCFLGPSEGQDERPPVPLVAWTDPAILWLESPAYLEPRLDVYALDERSMTLRLAARATARAGQ
ncbi:MAG: hypothetical protein HY908_25630 [Myxococcales bacterium]|nr:hypothetical protein [Myxococcales bacterium]